MSVCPHVLIRQPLVGFCWIRIWSPPQFYSVTCRPISRQRPNYAHATLEKVLQEMFSMWSAPCPLLGNDSVNTFPRQQSDTFRCYATAVNTTVEEEVFSTWFAYIHCWATDVFSNGPPRDYVRSPVVN
jgi:hypothetical protein